MLAVRKAESVAGRHADALVIGADTIVSVDGELLAKPVDGADAFRMLRLLSGRTHEVWTGVAVLKTDSRDISHDFVCTTV